MTIDRDAFTTTMDYNPSLPVSSMWFIATFMYDRTTTASGDVIASNRLSRINLSHYRRVLLARGLLTSQESQP